MVWNKFIINKVYFIFPHVSHIYYSLSKFDDCFVSTGQVKLDVMAIQYLDILVPFINQLLEYVFHTKIYCIQQPQK